MLIFSLDKKRPPLKGGLDIIDVCRYQSTALIPNCSARSQSMAV